MPIKIQINELRLGKDYGNKEVYFNFHRCQFNNYELGLNASCIKGNFGPFPSLNKVEIIKDSLYDF